MNPERRVELFENGCSQALLIRCDFELPGDNATIRKGGNRLIIEPEPVLSFAAYMAALEPIEDDFGAIDDLPADPVEL